MNDHIDPDQMRQAKEWADWADETADHVVKW